MGGRYRFAQFELQIDERRLLADGQPVTLGGHALDLLAALVARPGHLIGKAELLEAVWGKVVVEENSLQAQVSALRKMLGAAAIATVHGRGYRFELRVETLPSADMPLPTHKLPLALTRFIGREREMQQIRDLLANTRLLTLTGAGGCGKTRLALELAAQVAPSHADGVRLAELSSVADPTLLAQVLARALDLEIGAGRDPGELLVEHLQNKQLLLVLDNAEHLLDACAWWTERLLRQCERLCVLVTSRERLGIDGETAWRVPSLSLPSKDGNEDSLACEAVRLFIDRAARHRPGFEVSGDDGATLVSICRRLDGIALAIELAAAQMRMMSLQALHRGLDDRFRLLTGGSRSALPRHRTLAALITWSHERLSGPEQTLFRRVAVFAGGWTLQAAERVCSGDGLDATEVWGLLTALADKNLVLTDVGGDETRFGMLETVRHFALKQLLDAGEATVLRNRHLEFVIGVAGGLDARHADSEVQQALIRLGLENDNVRAALEWCEADPVRALTGLRLAGLLNWFWSVENQYKEARAWIARLLAAAGDGEPGEAHAAALHTSGALATFDGEPAAALDPLRRAAALWRQIGNPRELARSLCNLAEAEKMTGDHASSRTHYEEALAAARGIGDSRTEAFALLGVGYMLHRLGDFEAARPLVEAARSVARSVGPWVEGYMATMLGEVLHAYGDLASARQALCDAVEQLRDFGDHENLAFAFMLLAEVCQDQGDLDAARDFLQQPLGQYPRIFGGGHLDCLNAFAGLLSQLSGPLVGARLWGCVQRQAEVKPPVPDVWAHSRQQRLQQAARQALGDDVAFDHAWHEGRGWSLDQAFRYARAQA